MNTQVALQPASPGVITLSLDPDIVALGIYLAQKRGLSLEEFFEELIARCAFYEKQERLPSGAPAT